MKLNAFGWTEADLALHFQRALDSGWLPFFDSAAHLHHWKVAELLAIASRETRIRNIIGDGGHGHGLMQIDDRAFPDFIATGKALDPAANIHFGAQVLKAANLWLHTKPNPALIADLFPRAAYAAYNTGAGNVLKSIRAGRDVDHTTAHSSYSADVRARVLVFEVFLQSRNDWQIVVTDNEGTDQENT